MENDDSLMYDLALRLQSEKNDSKIDPQTDLSLLFRCREALRNSIPFPTEKEFEELARRHEC
jgi:hypothetical protein